MAIESALDLSAFFELDDFAVPALYTAAGKRAIVISGIFDNPSASQSVSDMIDVIIPQPRFTCRTVDVPNAAEADKIKINGKSYTIRIVTDDGEGVTTMMLERD